MGHIEDFEITDSGFLYVLAREVTKYSDSQVPVAFGSTYLLRFSPAGKFERQTKLNTDFGKMEPTGLAVLKGDNFLVVGYSYSPDKTIRLFVDLFSPDGSLKEKAPVSSERTEASNTGTVSSMSVLRPMAVRAGGFVFVLRGSTRDPVYVFSDTGELTRTVRLKAASLEFSSPMIFGNQLVVHQHRATPTTDGIRVLTEPELDVFPVFDLNSGALVQQFEWRQHGELACYDQSGLTIIQQGIDYPDHGYWAIISAQPSSTEPKQSRPTDGDIALQLRWVVPCADGAHSLPLRGDEAAQRYCLSENTLVDESDVDSASSYIDPNNQPSLRLTFTPEGSESFRRATGERIGEELGIVIDGALVFHVVVVEPFGHAAVITCVGLSPEELSDWVTRLNAKARRRVLRKSI